MSSEGFDFCYNFFFFFFFGGGGGGGGGAGLAGAKPLSEPMLDYC